MKAGFVIGNGESRNGFDLDILKKYGPVYGCNALYRDFIPDVLFVMDERMIKEVLTADINCEIVYRQHEPELYNEETVRIFVSTNGNTKTYDLGYSAGCSAVLTMCQRCLDLTHIYMLGFDMYSVDGKVNNVYKGTNGYVDADSKEQYARNWVNHLARIFLSNPHINFFRVGFVNNAIEIWDGITNVSFLHYEQFNDVLNGCGGNRVHNNASRP